MKTGSRSITFFFAFNGKIARYLLVFRLFIGKLFAFTVFLLPLDHPPSSDLICLKFILLSFYCKEVAPGLFLYFWWRNCMPEGPFFYPFIE